MISFEIIPNDLNEQLEFYENKIDELKKINVVLIENNYNLPNEKIKLMLNYSQNIRHIKKRILKNE